jgi:hypothetical protein
MPDYNKQVNYLKTSFHVQKIFSVGKSPNIFIYFISNGREKKIPISWNNSINGRKSKERLITCTFNTFDCHTA